MKILYSRVSSLGQNTARQVQNSDSYDLIIEDKISGSVPFFTRNGGSEISRLVSQGCVSRLDVHSIDRLGRNLLDVMSTLQFFSENGVPVCFKQQGLITLDEDGRENSIAKMTLSILATVAEMQRNQIRENQREGIEIAKAKGVYGGRKKGTKENLQKFLSKPKNIKAVELLKKGYRGVEVGKIVGLHPNSITKVRKLAGLAPN